MRFRTKPVKIEAMQFDGTAENFLAIRGWTEKHGTCVQFRELKNHLRIPILGGAVYAEKNDWIIKDDLRGDFYPASQTSSKRHTNQSEARQWSS